MTIFDKRCNFVLVLWFLSITTKPRHQLIRYEIIKLIAKQVSRHTSYTQILFYCMNRILHLQTHLIKGETFQEFKRSSTIDKQEFNKTVYGSNYKDRLDAFDLINKHPHEFQHYHLTQADRSHQRQVTTKQFLRVFKHFDIQKNSLTNPNRITLYGNGLTFYDLNLTTKAGVHYSLYLKSIQRLGTEKHKHFYQRACRIQDLGCFALTEIMHGSNVKGLLTEAHYYHQNREIIIHSPSKEAMKFWIGGSAKTSNMCVVWAQLYIKQKNYGVHAFVVPLRCPKTHRVLPGITIGDCGPKFGLNAIDNGFIIFNKFRIPVDNLLDKVSGVNEKGEFFSTVQGQNKRFGMTLAALSEGRLFMCCHSTSLGLTALTIALRYAFVRRQFANKKGEKQLLLIQYPLTQRRMIPLLAQQIIYMCVTMKTFQQSENNQQKNVLSPSNPIIQQIHAISSVLKAKTAWAATEVIRQSRQMMGGHGFSAYSKMGALYSNNDVNNTWQGQNNVLIQQTTKYILGNLQKSMQGKAIKSPLLQFLNKPLSDSQLQINRESLLNFEKIQLHLQKKIVTKAQELGTKMMTLREQNMANGDIWNSSQVFLGQTASLIAGDLYILKSSLVRLGEIKDLPTRKVFEDVLHLWTFTIMKNDESFSQDMHGEIEKLIQEYSLKLVPQILGLLQSVSANDVVIGSPFADQFGKGFEKYMNFVLSQPRKERADYWKIIAQR